MIANCTNNQIVKCLAEIGSLFQFIGKNPETLGNDCVQHNICIRDGSRGTERTEFKLVSGKRKRRGTVSVCGILRNFGQDMDADGHIRFFTAVVVFARFQGFENLSQFISEENADDCRRRFAAAEPMVVAG